VEGYSKKRKSLERLFFLTCRRLKLLKKRAAALKKAWWRFRKT
jgi:hypothetical protein